MQNYINLYKYANGCITFFEKIIFYMLYNIKDGVSLARVKKNMYLCELFDV